MWAGQEATLSDRIDEGDLVLAVWQLAVCHRAVDQMHMGAIA